MAPEGTNVTYQPAKLSPGAYAIRRGDRPATYATNWQRAVSRAARLRRTSARREARFARALAPAVAR